MRTNIDIDDDLLSKAMELTGHTTKKAIVEEDLRELVLRQQRKKAFDGLRGLGWEGDLDGMREGRSAAAVR